MGNRDFTQQVAEELGYYIDYGLGPTKHTWGCAMLSRFPIIKSVHHMLPSPVGELACAIHATLNVHGTPVDFIFAHNGQEEDFHDRELQTSTLAAIASSSPNPIVYLGYVVSKPFGPIYGILISKGQLTDIYEKDWDRWCEYIAFRGVKRIGYARISHGGITDT